MPVQPMDQCLKSGNKHRSVTVTKRRTSASKRKKKKIVYTKKNGFGNTLE